MSEVKCFYLDRKIGPTGVSGTGVVAQGVQFTDGTVVVRWLGEHRTTTVHPCIETVVAVHCHKGQTLIRWVASDHEAVVKGLQEEIEALTSAELHEWCNKRFHWYQGEVARVEKDRDEWKRRAEGATAADLAGKHWKDSYRTLAEAQDKQVLTIAADRDRLAVQADRVTAVLDKYACMDNPRDPLGSYLGIRDDFSNALSATPPCPTCGKG